MRSPFAQPLTTAILIAGLTTPPLATSADFSPLDFDCGIGKAVIIEETPLWSFSGGATVRSINASFSSATPDFNRQTGHGDPGLYNRHGRVTYKDGYVEAHPHAPWSGDSAGGYVNSASQIRVHPLGKFAPDTAGDPLRNYVVDFHSDEFDYSDLQGISANNSDSDNGVGPYLQMGRRLERFSAFQVNLTAGWSFLSTNHSTGARPVARITENRTDHTYSYDYIAVATKGPLIPGLVASTDHLFIYNPLTAYSGLVSNRNAPSQQSVTTSTLFTAYNTSNLNVNLNEVPIGMEVGRKAGPVDLLLTGGLTLNVVDYELENRFDWVAAGSSSPIASQVARDSGTPLKVGLYGGVVARCNLSKDGRLFLESSGTYRWVDPVHASAGLASVEIDPSSFQGRLGIGIRF